MKMVRTLVKTATRKKPAEPPKIRVYHQPQFKRWLHILGERDFGLLFVKGRVTRKKGRNIYTYELIEND